MHTFILQTKRFIRNEDGIATAWAIGWLILCFSIAGLSIDATNAWKVKQILQSTADVAAHAGGLELGTVGNDSIEAAVISSANQYAMLNMNSDRYGDVLVDSDIQVGHWNHDTQVFTEMAVGDLNPPRAVRVVTRQDGVNSSKVGTFFLRFIGFDAFTVSTEAIVESFVSICEKDGLKAYGNVRMSTQQSFLGRYCVHGEGGINFSTQNFFDDGAIASMVDLNDCGPDLDHCMDDLNPGVEAALTQDSGQTFGKLIRIDETIANLQNPRSDDIAELGYITNPVVKEHPYADFDATQLVEGAINYVDCGGGQGNNLDMGGLAAVNNRGGGTDDGAATIAEQITKANIVVVGINCDFGFDKSISYESAVFATTATGRQTVSSSAGAIFGRPDNCGKGGEVAIVTKGDVHFAAQINAFDLEMIVLGDVGLASLGNNGDSVHEGTSIMAGGDINITTKHTFANCFDTETALDVKFTLRYVK